MRAQLSLCAAEKDAPDEQNGTELGFRRGVGVVWGVVVGGGVGRGGSVGEVSGGGAIV